MALVTLHYHNRALGKTEPVTMILPEAKDAWQPPFPVVYLLHGIGDDHTDWMRRTRIEAYVESLPLIVVMPTTPWQSMYVDGVHGAPAATAIAKELVDFVDSRFQTARMRASGRCAAFPWAGTAPCIWLFCTPSALAPLRVTRVRFILDVRSMLPGTPRAHGQSGSSA